jgi:protein-L-isoaspartate O-methyltransferase
MNFGGALEWPSKWTRGTFSNGNVVCPVQVEQTQGVLRAVVDISVSTNTRHRKKVELRPNYGAGDG